MGEGEGVTMIIKSLLRMLTLLSNIQKIGLVKFWRLRRLGVHHSRYQLFNKKWLKALNVKRVIDVGANKGEFSIIFSELFEGAEIDAFEPLPQCVEILSKLETKISRICVHPFAISEMRGKSKFNVSSHDPSSSLLLMSDLHKEHYPHSSGSKQIIVECETLDEFYKETTFNGVTILKIDVQGGEKSVLIGGKNTLKNIDIVVLEISFVQLYEGEANFDQIYSLLRDMGFEFRGMIKQSISKQTDQFLQCDAIFQRKNIEFS